MEQINLQEKEYLYKKFISFIVKSTIAISAVVLFIMLFVL